VFISNNIFLLTAMKHFTTLAAALLLFSCVAFSQTSPRASVAGRVIETSKKPLPFATVLLLKAADSSLVKGAISTENGRYEFENLPLGRYLVSATMVGYAKVFGSAFELTASNAPLLLPDLTVTEATQTLGEVKVVTQKPFIEQQIDRTVLNVENSSVSAGSTALEVLEKAPGITVDQQNDRLVVKGKQGVIVQIDGKQTFLSTQELMNLLRNTPADNIEKVEIISNPSAKYDAAGNSGIINIKTKKNKNFGTNGTATLGTGYGRYEKANASLNLNHRVGKINAFGNYSYFRNRNFNEQQIYRNIPFEGKTTIFDQNGNNINRNNGHNAKVGLDWFIDKKHTVGVLLSGFDNHFNGSSLSNTLISAPTGQTLLSTTNAPNNTFQNITANLNYKYELGKSRELTADADYSYFDGQSGNFLDSRFTNLQGELTLTDLVRNNMPSNIGIWAGKIDYVHPLKKGKIETGWKSSWVQTDNDMKFETNTDQQWRIDPTRTNRFKYDENINALYLNYATAIGKKTQLQTGLRVENTHSVGNSVTLNSVIDRNYTNLFPSVFVSQTLDSNNVLNLSYSRRIDRPNYQDLNPFESFLDPFTFQRGNPFLRPQFTNSFSLTHVFKGFISTTLSYARTTDLIQEQAPDQIAAENKTFVTSVNVDKFDNYSLNVSFPLPINKWWTMQNNLTVFHNRYQTVYREGLFDVSITAYNLYSSNNFKLSKTLSAEVSAFYNSAGLFGFFRNEPMGAFNLGVQKSWLGGKLRGRLNFQDPFWLNQFRGSTEFQDLNFSVRSRWESRVARVSLTYRFGNQNVKASRQRQTSAEDLRDRVKQN
jgi:Outer membrane protein beta-barrel family/Carboxypeptidase regulatory-like domain